MKNSFGNYVIQSALEKAKGKVLPKMVEAVLRVLNGDGLPSKAQLSNKIKRKWATLIEARLGTESELQSAYDLSAFLSNT